MRETDTIRAGEMRSRVTFKIKPTDGDTTGYVDTLTSSTTLADLEAWETRATVSCKRSFDRGLEAHEDRQDISISYETLYIRYNPAMLPLVTDAAICDGKIYEIFSPPREINGRNKKVSISIRAVQ